MKCWNCKLDGGFLGIKHVRKDKFTCKTPQELKRLKDKQRKLDLASEYYRRLNNRR